MDVGTAKLAPAERAGVPHHLLDVLDVTETASVAAYQRAARAVVEDLRGPGSHAGAGRRLGAVRAGRGGRAGVPGTDPGAARGAGGRAGRRRTGCTAHPAGRRRPRRRGGGAAEQRAADRAGAGGRGAHRPPVPGPTRDAAAPPRYGAVLLGVDRPTGELDERVARRVARMFARGLVAETRALLDHGLREGRTASRALGYQQVVAALDGCVPTVDDSARPRRTRCAPPGGSSAGSAPGSAATAASPGSTRAAGPARGGPLRTPGCHDRRSRSPRATAPRTTSSSCPTRTARST